MRCPRVWEGLENSPAVVVAQPEVQVRRSEMHAAQVEWRYPENLARERPVPPAIPKERPAAPMKAIGASYP
jgi:hypothetical protein